MTAKEKHEVYDWDDAPNIDLTDPRVLWWNEKAICIRRRETKREYRLY